MKTHITMAYMVKRKRKRLSRSVLAGITDRGLMKMKGGVNHNDLQTVDGVLNHH